MSNGNENYGENEKQITKIRHKIDLDIGMDPNEVNIK